MADDTPDLVVTAGADTSGVTTGFARATAEVTKFGDNVKKESDKADKGVQSMASSMIARLGVVVGALGSVYGALTATATAASRASQIGGLAETFHMTAEQASGLAGAMEQSGIKLDQFERSVQHFNNTLSRSISRPMSDMAILFRQMGISMTDANGQARTFADVMPELAERFSSYTDEVRKGQIATVLFGSAGSQAISGFLSQGVQGIRDASTAMQRYGIVTTDQVKAAQEYETATQNMQRAVSGLVNEFSIRLAPAITYVADALTRLIQLLPRANFDLNAMNTEQLQQEAEAAMVRIGQLRDQLFSLRQQPRGTGLGPQIDAGIAQLNAQLEVAEQRLRVVQGLLGVGPRPPPTAPQGTPTPDVEAVKRAYEAARHELDLFVDRLEGTRLITDELNFRWQTHAEVMEQVRDRVNAAFADQAQAARRLAQIELQLNKQQQANMLQTATLAATLITTLWPKSKGAAIAAAAINTAVGITKVLSEVLPPWSWIQAGLIAATGAAQIANIRATSPTGGPTPTVSGAGSAGATPDQTGGGGRELMISGLTPEGRYGGQSVIDLIAQINEEVRNGANLISTRSMKAATA